MKMAMFDVNSIEAEVLNDLAQDRAADAKGKIKQKLVQIQKANKVVETLKMEYKELLAEIALDA